MVATHPLLVAVALIAGAVAIGALVAALFAALQGRSRGAVAGEALPRPTSWVAGLSKTRGNLARRLFEAWAGTGGGDAWLERVEEVLLGSDVGVKATSALLERLAPRLRDVQGTADLREVLRSTVRDLLADGQEAAGADHKPLVIMVVGVNGVGKTTTIGKLAHYHARRGRKVLLVAGDTFRAAAIEQLARWAERVGAGVVKHQHGADPSAVAFDGMKAAVARGVDVVIVDTAGRLHVKENLMEEVKKIGRTLGRQVEGAPHEVLLVIDATTGQNAINQARVFHEALGVTGIVLAKLDGTAKGGVVLAIRGDLGLPIRYVGLGEGPEDLAPFDAGAFADALFSETELTDAA
jgi:fused signal recognition particle receptor